VELRERVRALRLRVVSAAHAKVEGARTRYVSHMRIVFGTEISRMSRQFIHRNANCMNSTPCCARCAASGAARARQPLLPTTRGRARTVDAPDELGHAAHGALNARLPRDVVVRDAVEEAREAPERVRLGRRRRAGRERARVEVRRGRVCAVSRAPERGRGAHRCTRRGRPRRTASRGR
jgi:hypothetical protein